MECKRRLKQILKIFYFFHSEEAIAIKVEERKSELILSFYNLQMFRGGLFTDCFRIYIDLA